MELTIDEIIKLTPVRVDKFYHQFSDFSRIFAPLYGVDSFTELPIFERVTEYSFVLDKCNDGRARQLHILSYDKMAFAVYQYIGKGYVENEAVIDRMIYLRFIRDTIEQLSLKNIKANLLGKEDKYKVKNYGMGEFTIEGNTLVAFTKS